MAEYIEREAVLAEIDERISNIAFSSPYQNEIDIMVSGMERARNSVEDAPAADVVEVVRCKDCCLGKPWSDGSVSCQRLAVENDYMADLWMKPDDFCSYGEKRELKTEE